MPNLLPESIVGFRLDWMHPAGRLIWSLLVTGVGIVLVLALLRPPLERKLVTARQAVAGSAVVLVLGIVAAKMLSSVQILVVWVALAGILALALAAVVSRDPRSPDQPTTWVEAMGGALAVLVLFTLVYGIIPHEWLTFANSYLNMGSDRFFTWAGDRLVKLPYSAVRDSIAALIYVVALGANVVLWIKWQERLTPKPEPAEGEKADTVVRTSRFGRPLRVKA